MNFQQVVSYSKIISGMIFLLSANAIFCEQSQHQPFDPFVYLPQESLIKQECKECGFGGLFYSSEKQKGCAYIKETLAAFNEHDPEQGLFSVLFELFIGPNGRDLIGHLGHEENVRKMKKHVFAVLGDKYSKEQMREEHTLLAKTAEYIRSTRQERKEQAQKAARQSLYTKRNSQDPY